MCCSYSGITIHGALVASSCADSFSTLDVSTFRSMCAVPNMAVFCSSLTFRLLLLLLLLLQQANRQSTEKHNTYQFLFMYGTPHDNRL
jgi:hypothetical protein